MLLKHLKRAGSQELTRAAGSFLLRRPGGVVLAALLLAWSASGTTFPVSMTDFVFAPANLTVNVGDTVTWNGVSDSHTATSGANGTPDGLWDSGNVDPGGSYSFIFNATGNYPYFCAYHVSLGMVGSVTVVAGNNPPTVAITAPTNGASYTPGSDIVVQATAADSDGSVARVDFFANGVTLGSVTNLPYTVTMTNVVAGAYALSAVATDNQGAASTSSVVNISVQASNALLSVTITNPINGQRFVLGASVLVQAATSDSGGTVTQVEFFAASTSLGVATHPPFSVIVSNLAAGSINLTAVATDDRGGVGTSLPVNVTVVNPPSVTLTAPTNGTIVPVGNAVALQATASSVGGAIVSVEFFAGNTRLGTATAPPFSANWTPATPGPATLLAVAHDDLGQTTTSTAVAVRAFLPDNLRPTLRITGSPANFARLNAAGVTLSGTAADNVGLDRVEFQLNHGPFAPAAGTTSWQAQVQLSPGMNVVGVRAVDLAGNASLEVFRYFTLVANSRLGLQIVGSGVVIPALGGRLLQVGKAYRLTAQPGQGQVFAGWGGGISNATSMQLSFLMQTNLQLTATFVASPFTVVSGYYAGLMLNTNGAYPANTAGFNLALSPLGSFSGKLTMNGASFPFTGRFDLLGSAKASVLRRGLTPIVLTLQLGLDPATGQITGTATDGTWISSVLGVRTLFGQAVGTGPQGAQRPFELRPAAADGGDTAAVCVARIGNTGSVSIRGTLADRSAFGVASAISADGQVPLYVSFSHGSEMLAGWIRFDLQGATAPSGGVIWSQAQTNGFSQTLEVTAP